MKNSILLFLATAVVLFGLAACEPLSFNDPGVLVPLTVDEDQTLPAIEVNGTRLHSEAFGNPNDPMIVVIHGGPGSDYRSMMNCIKFTADSFAVVFYDQRGSGLSRRHDKGTYNSISVYLNDLGGVIAHYRQSPNQKVILMGLSWGAMLATAYVNEYPSAISGVVLMEPGGFTWDDTKEYIERTRDNGIFEELANDYFYLDQIITGEGHAKLDYKAGLQSAANFADRNKLGNAGPYPFWRVGAVCSIASMEYAEEHPFNFTTQLHQYGTQILFAYSELNQAYGRGHAEHVSSAYPNVRLEEIKGTGHEIPYFGWDKFYPIAKSYLTTVR